MRPPGNGLDDGTGTQVLLFPMAAVLAVKEQRIFGMELKLALKVDDLDNGEGLYFADGYHYDAMVVEVRIKGAEGRNWFMGMFSRSQRSQ